MLPEWGIMINSRGDAVLVVFPNSDLVTFKKRPALVVQSNRPDTGIPQAVLALITTMQRTGPTRVSVSIDSSPGKAMGLLHDSVVVTDNLATVLDKQVDKVIGRCPIMSSVDVALRHTLDL